MPILEVRGLSARYQLKDSVVQALDGVDLSVDEGEFFVLLGPSGCGKTTMLRSIAGLERPVAGEILIDGEPVFSSDKGIFVPPNQRPIAMVFQSYAIWPHMDVFDNVAFPLRRGRLRLDAREINARVGEMLEMLGLSGMEHRPVTTLSGGQQQRVALARALALRPRVLLMDEPLSNLDFRLQVRLRSELRELMHRLNLTTVHVTHNQGEALETGDRIAVMKSGRTIQISDPFTIYRRPTTEFVARFIGDMNLVGGVVDRVDGDTAEVVTPLGRLKAMLPEAGALGNGDACVVGIRPEDVELTSEGGERGSENVVRGQLKATRFVGEALIHTVAAEGEALDVKLHHGTRVTRGEDVSLRLPPEWTIAVSPSRNGDIDAPAEAAE